MVFPVKLNWVILILISLVAFSDSWGFFKRLGWSIGGETCFDLLKSSTLGSLPAGSTGKADCKLKRIKKNIKKKILPG